MIRHRTCEFIGNDHRVNDEYVCMRVCERILLNNNVPLWIEGCSETERDEITCSFTMMHVITLIVYLNDGRATEEKKRAMGNKCSIVPRD